jgi:multiple sugar transport system substrate-binding protein
MKKRILAAFCFSVVLAIAGCSGAETAEPTEETPAASTPETKAPESKEPPAEPVKLKIGLPGAYDVTKKEIIDGFIASHPNVQVEIVEAPWGDFVKKIQTEIAGGTAPDVWFQENAVILGYGKRGVAEDLTPYFQELNADDYVPGLSVAKGTDGKIYGVPHGVNPIALAYNKKMFDEAGIPYPTNDWTYQDMIDAAKKLTKDTNGDGKPEQYGFAASNSITVGWYPWTRSKGGMVLDETKTKAMFTDPKSIEGIQTWSNLVKEGISPTQDLYDAVGGDWKAFASGQAAMFFLQYNVQALIAKDFPDLDYDTVMIPKGFDGKRIVPMVSNSWLVFSKAKPEAKEAAWLFLKYYLGDEAQDILAESGASLPVKKSSIGKLDKESRPQNKAAFSQGIEEGGTTLDENPSWNDWRTQAQPIYREIFDQKISPEEGAKQIQEKVQQILDENQ